MQPRVPCILRLASCILHLGPRLASLRLLPTELLRVALDVFGGKPAGVLAKVFGVAALEADPLRLSGPNALGDRLRLCHLPAAVTTFSLLFLHNTPTYIKRYGTSQLNCQVLTFGASLPHSPPSDKALMIRFLAISLAFLPLVAGASHPIVGEWEKEDGQARLLMKVENGKLNGYLSQVAGPGAAPDGGDPNPALRKHRLIGLRIVKGFWKENDKWVGGRLYDARNGKDYKGALWLEGRDKLKMRGYLGIPALGQTVTWRRVK